MKVVEIKTAGMIATSMELNRNQTVSGSSALSRESGGGGWDDEE